MKKHKSKVERPRYLKRKLTGALSMLLVSAIMLTATSYAWLVLSTAPEVAGITTNIGANGALEIALLTGETRQDLSKIKSTIGDSLALESKTANNNWGNMIDLSFSDYGLSEIVLLPARINYVPQNDGTYKVNSGLLSVPVYGYDGRVIEVDDSAFTATFDGNVFSYEVGTSTPDYGVRAIGTSEALSMQASALAMAKSNVSTYTANARSTAANTLNKNGEDLFGIMFTHASSATATFNDSNVATIKAMVADLQKSMDYIDLALRQGLVAVAAAEIADEATFDLVQDRIMDTGKELSAIIAELTEFSTDSIPADYDTWITKASDSENYLWAANNECNGLAGGSYTWDQIKAPLNYIMNTELVYVNEKLFTELDDAAAMEMLASGAEMTLPSGSGVFADVADFADNYDAAFTAMNVSVTVETLSTVDDGPYLIVLYDAIKDLEATDGSDSGKTKAELSTTYGYALDTAFRCNAAGTSKLLLQTAAKQRIYSDSTSISTMGGGSYMEFSTNDDSLTLEQVLQLMDAVRVAFLDDQGNLLKVAKLNISNRVVNGGAVKAPLYLYEFSFSEEDGSMIMGERLKAENAITSLEQNVAKTVTTVVWLDGDIVDNSMVSATERASLTGVLNLQFATDANLVPAGNNALKNATVDKTKLKAAIDTAEETYVLGQGTYTTVSWNAFVDAYTYASAVYESTDITETQIRIASSNLAQATVNLQQVSHNALTAKINDIRSVTGQTTDVAAYVRYDEVNDTYVTVDPYTEEQKDNTKGTIYRVDYANNLNDEGNEMYTRIYSDESWSALAAALYSAEAVNMYDGASDAQLDAAIVSLETAYGNLQRCVFYTAYEYEENIYYYAIPRKGEATEDTQDTYGRWYDAQFKRITSDLTILNLDAQAETARVAFIEQSQYVSSQTTLAPVVELYSSWSDDEIIGIQWTIPENLLVRSITSAQITTLTTLKGFAEELNRDSYTNLQVSESLLVKAENAINASGEDLWTEEDAEYLIFNLENAIYNATYVDEDDEDDAESTPMTEEQRIVLTTAVNKAKAVDGYDSTTNSGEDSGEGEDANAAKLEALREATADVEELLALETGATAEDADTKLDALNAALTDLGEKEVTAYNTLQYSIPIGSEMYEVVYGENPHNTLKSTGEMGTGIISAVILTKNGIVYALDKNVTIYSAAAGVSVIGPDTAPVGGQMEITGEGEDAASEWNNVIQGGETTTLSAELISRTKEATDENGEIIVDENNTATLVEIPTTETVAEYTWASSNTNVLTISNEKAAVCTINAIDEGNAWVSLSVTTNEGNTYTDSITITVTAVPESESTESGEGENT